MRQLDRGINHRNEYAFNFCLVCINEDVLIIGIWLLFSFSCWVKEFRCFCSIMLILLHLFQEARHIHRYGTVYLCFLGILIFISVSQSWLTTSTITTCIYTVSNVMLLWAIHAWRISQTRFFSREALLAFKIHTQSSDRNASLFVN